MTVQKHYYHTKPKNFRCSKNNYHKWRNWQNKKIRKMKHLHRLQFKNHRKMNNKIKLTIWVYYLYRRPHSALKKNRNNPVMMASILNDLTLHPCQIIMKKISQSKLLKNKRENSKKDKEKHQHITWREKLNFNLNKKQSQMKILHKMMIHLNQKDHNFNIIQMVKNKEQKLH